MNTAFPYQSKNINPEDVFYVKEKEENITYKKIFEVRKLSKEAKIFKSQYLNIEKMLLDAFQFVSPSEKNSKTYSVSFATIIKESANLFELICKYIYKQLYVLNNDDIIGISNYLSLNKHIEFCQVSVLSNIFYDHFRSPEIYEPFFKIKQWDKVSKVDSTHIPSWWTAYNKLKHTNEGLETYATLENAIASVAADFILLHKIFGPGLVFGVLLTYSGFINFPQTSAVFMIDE